MAKERLARRVAAVLILCGAAMASIAQDYPARPVRLVVPFPAGGAPDTVARTLGESFSARWGQQVLVENRLGAGGNVAYGSVASAPPDGYTLLLAATGIATNVSLYRSLPYDPVKDFAPISLVASSPHMLVVNPSLVSATSVRELVAQAKARPGQISFGSAGSGTVLHLAGEMFKSMAGVDLLHIPYKGTQPAMADLLGGRIGLMYIDIAPSLQHIRSGRLRVLATTAGRRTAVFPDVPTIAEAGVPGYEIVAWFGLLAPAATPRGVVDRVHQATVAMVGTPEVRARLGEVGIELVGGTPEQFGAYIRSEIDVMAKVVKASGAKPD